MEVPRIPKITNVVLDVVAHNKPAILAYENLGFKYKSTDPGGMEFLGQKCDNLKYTAKIDDIVN